MSKYEIGNARSYNPKQEPSAVRREEHNGTLHNWDMLTNGRIRGVIEGDTKGRFFDGQVVLVSVTKDIPEEGKIITTRNSKYLLGKRLNND